MMTWSEWAAVGFSIATVLAVVIARIIEVRGRPQCPEHPGRSMELVDEVLGNEEFICRTKGCKHCVTRYPSGELRRYTT
jgi:hypothetical protein